MPSHGILLHGTVENYFSKSLIKGNNWVNSTAFLEDAPNSVLNMANGIREIPMTDTDGLFNPYSDTTRATPIEDIPTVHAWYGRYPDGDPPKPGRTYAPEYDCAVRIQSKAIASEDDVGYTLIDPTTNTYRVWAWTESTSAAGRAGMWRYGDSRVPLRGEWFHNGWTQYRGRTRPYPYRTGGGVAGGNNTYSATSMSLTFADVPIINDTIANDYSGYVRLTVEDGIDFL